jgi:hypothetical protein
MELALVALVDLLLGLAHRGGEGCGQGVHALVHGQALAMLKRRRALHEQALVLVLQHRHKAAVQPWLLLPEQLPWLLLPLPALRRGRAGAPGPLAGSKALAGSSHLRRGLHGALGSRSCLGCGGGGYVLQACGVGQQGAGLRLGPVHGSQLERAGLPYRQLGSAAARGGARVSISAA